MLAEGRRGLRGGGRRNVALGFLWERFVRLRRF